MVRTNQGGSVLSFVIVGVILTGLVVGGAYIVHQQTTQPVPTQPQPVATQPDKTQSQTPAKPDEKAEDKPSEQPAQGQPIQPSQESTPIPTENAPIVDTLPHTGPVETTGVLIALTLLSIASVSYVRSRRLELPL